MSRYLRSPLGRKCRRPQTVKALYGRLCVTALSQRPKCSFLGSQRRPRTHLPLSLSSHSTIARLSS